MRTAIATLTAALALAGAPAALADTGSFSSSDPLLNQIWAASVRTATGMVAPGR